MWRCAFVSRARITSRATSVSSDAAGIPPMPRSVEYVPSCMTPPSLRFASSSCRDDRNAQHRAVLERAPHQLRVVDRLAVVAHRNAAGQPQVASSASASLLAPCSPHRSDRRARSVARRLRDDHLPSPRARRSAEPCSPSRKPPCIRPPPRRACRWRSSLCAPARLAKMRVQIDEARRDDESVASINLRARFDFLVDARNRAVFDEDVELRVDVLEGSITRAFLNEETHDKKENVECSIVSVEC